MSNSSLVKYTKLSPNRNIPRNHAIDTITIHCYASQASVREMGAWFAKTSTQASANYGIGSDGQVGLFVPEADRSWCSSSRENDHRAITIECACNPAAPNAVNSKVYASLIDLCVDICQRNGIKRLIWSTKQNDRMKHLNGCNMTVHRDYAAKACPGDWLYARMGQIADAVNSRINPSKASGVPTSKADYINKVSEIAVRLYEETRILPSVVIAQCCLENGYGLGADAVELTKRNNLLGMKADLTNTWKDFTVWDGKTFTKKTPEYINGKLVYKYDVFRIYKDYENCIRDYEQFLLHVRNDLGYKYRSVQGMTDPLNVITVISRGGYATDPAYVDKVMRIIGENDLTKYDPVQPRDHYAVQRRLSETKYRIGLFHNLDNAKRQANDNWGYRVYDMDIRKCVYKPKLARWQKLCAACVRINQWMADDVKAGKDWYYDNVNKSEPTFWLTRKAKKYHTNCMGGVGFAMKEAGIPASSCDWYMSKGGITWLNKAVEKNLRKYADIIPVGDRTLKQIMDDGTLCPGDITGFMTMNHTLIYIGNGLFFDSGHAYCKDGDHFTKWIGELKYGGKKVSYLVRLKG